MALADNSRNLRIVGTQLSGETKKDGSWTGPVTIDLNPKFDNDEGNFKFGGSNFSPNTWTRSGQNIRVAGTELRAKLKKRDGAEQEANFDLAKVLRVKNDGTFFFITTAKYQYNMTIENGGRELQESIRDFAAKSKGLRIDGTRLSGEAKKTNGTWARDTIDLQFKLGNENGKFCIDGSNFGENAQNIGVDGTTLEAKLRNRRNTNDEAFVELAAILKIVDGNFFFRSEYENRLNYISTPARSLADNSRNLHIIKKYWVSGEVKNGGSWTSESIDLTPKLGNRDGEFDFKGDKAFNKTAANIRVEGATLRADLKKVAGYHVDASLDLALILQVVSRKFEFIPYEPRLLPSDFKGPGLVANSRNLYVRGATLYGETKKNDGTWTHDMILLNPHIGNDNGRFNLAQRHFVWSASNFKIKGTTFLASLNNGSSWPSEASLDLSLVITVNATGKFVFMTEHQRKRIVSSVFCMFVEKGASKVELHGLCLNKYGKLEASSIDLNNYYKSDGSASLPSDSYDERSRNLVDTVREVSVNVTGAEVVLNAKLLNGRDASVNLNINIENRDGRFHYERHDRPLGRDGAVTKFFEALPVVGYFAALVHLLNGDNEWAKRAVAVATSSTIVFVGVTIGSLIGGPVGAALGAGIATPLGIIAEVEIKKTIEPDVRIQFEEATVGRYIYETLRNMLAAGAAAKFAGWIEKIGLPYFSRVVSELGRDALNFTSTRASSTAMNASLKKISNALLTDRLPREWLEAEEKVKRL